MASEPSARSCRYGIREDSRGRKSESVGYHRQSWSKRTGVEAYNELRRLGEDDGDDFCSVEGHERS